MKNTYLDSATKLQIKLAGTVTATQLDWTCSYYNRVLASGVVTEGEFSGVTNNATAVDILPAPAAGSVRIMKNITVYNADSSTQTAIIQLVDAGGTRVLIRNSLTSLASWSADDMSFYTDISGKADTNQTMYIGTTSTAINRTSAAQTLAGITLTTPDIGTPSAGTLTNCTGLPADGVVDTAVTLTATQSLTNKTFGDAITNTQITTPSNPASGKNKIYFKSDDKLYKLTSGGTETEIGAGGGGGGMISKIAEVNGTTFVGMIGYYVCPAAITIAGVKATVLTLPTGSSIYVDIRRNGTASTNSIFTSDTALDLATGTSATNGVYTVSKTTIDNGTCSANDVLYVYITQIGSTTAGTDLIVSIY